jgi:NAD(P)-dependent dehydrogenase (short-subunit alcohol dehydrogenase family)
MTYETKTAVITGGSRGLGLALAVDLATDGWNVVVDGRDRGRLAVAADSIARLGPVRAVPGDVRDESHRRALVAAAVELGGGIDLLVHNASALGPSPLPPLDEYPMGELLAVYEVNVVAPLRLSQLVLPVLRPGGRILAVTSDAAVEPYEGWGGYGSSKAALEQLFAVLGVEHPEVRVYRVDPGDMNTEMHQAAFPGEDISDRPPPAASVPGLRRLIDGDLPSGRYEARAIAPAPVGVAS